jgi:hypothetical protein
MAGTGTHQTHEAARCALQLWLRRSRRDLMFPPRLTLERFRPYSMAINVDLNTSLFACAKNVTSSN